MAIDALLEDLIDNWGWLALRGVVAILFGVFALLWPGSALAVLVLVWGAFALADGVLALGAAFRVRDRSRPFWSLAVVGSLGITAGVLTFLWPAMTAFALLIFIASWALMMGIFQIAAAIRLRKELEGEWMLALSGILSVILGAMLFLWPGAGLLALVWVIGAYAIFFGTLLLLLALRLRGYSTRLARV